MKRVIVRGCVIVDGARLFSSALELHHGSVAEIDIGGVRPVAWVNGEAFELSVQS